MQIYYVNPSGHWGVAYGRCYPEPFDNDEMASLLAELPIEPEWIVYSHWDNGSDSKYGEMVALGVNGTYYIRELSEGSCVSLNEWSFCRYSPEQMFGSTVVPGLELEPNIWEKIRELDPRSTAIQRIERIAQRWQYKNEIAEIVAAWT